MDLTKPRVAIYYDVLPSTGMRNDGGSLFMNYNLRKLLDGRTPSADNRFIQTTDNVAHLSPINPINLNGKFDLHVLVDYGEDGLAIPLDWEIPHPNAYWVADSHLGYEYRLKRAKQFDHVFVSHKPSIEKFIQDGIPAEKIHYLPWAAEPDVYRPVSIIEKWDWCFIGHMNNDFRIDLIDRFCREWPVGINGYLGWRMAEAKGHNVMDDCAKKFCQSRIVLNEAVKDDLNMRVFEGLACKRLLLTEDIPAVRDHFEDGTHLVLFKTIEEAVQKARVLLGDDDLRNRIADQGYAEFLSKHTYNHRAREILKVCLNWEPKEEAILAGTL